MSNTGRTAIEPMSARSPAAEAPPTRRKSTADSPLSKRFQTAQPARRCLHWTKKSPNVWFGLNPPLEEGGGDIRRLPQRDNQWSSLYECPSDFTRKSALRNPKP
ncbi:hypothetical protein BVI2075_220010 [Burkholderia vietnamiensis]|nr:hypothetical protein BVI2075_220010 [Burkholderia vietnamiensis]